MVSLQMGKIVFQSFKKRQQNKTVSTIEPKDYKHFKQCSFEEEFPLNK